MQADTSLLWVCRELKCVYVCMCVYVCVTDVSPLPPVLQHYKRLPVGQVVAGQTAALALKKVKRAQVGGGDKGCWGAALDPQYDTLWHGVCSCHSTALIFWCKI
jgi:hypothetical protein